MECKQIASRSLASAKSKKKMKIKRYLQIEFSREEQSQTANPKEYPEVVFYLREVYLTVTVYGSAIP